MDAERERELIEEAKRDKRAFGRLYDEYYEKIFGYVLTRTSDIQISQDITSETFFKALSSINQFRWQSVPFSAWLYRIANHEIANHYRQNGHGLVLVEKITETFSISYETPESEIEDAEEELSKRKTFLVLHDMLSRLPLKYQEVLVLRFFDDKKIDEIGAILGKNQGIVKHLLYRGLARLQSLLQQDGVSCQAKQDTLEDTSYGKLRIV